MATRELSPVWSLDLGDRISLPPLLWRDRVVVRTGARLVAVDRAGETVFSTEVDSSGAGGWILCPAGALVCGDRTVDDRSELFAVDSAGELRWVVPSGADVRAAALIEGVLFWLSKGARHESVVRGVDVASGTICSERTLPTPADDLVAIGGRLLALHWGTGGPGAFWIPTASGEPEPVSTDPVRWAGRFGEGMALIARSPDAESHRLEVMDEAGAIRRALPVRTAGCDVDGDDLFVITGDGAPHASLRSIAGNGEPRWQAELSADSELIRLAGPVAAVVSRAKLLLLDRTTGARLGEVLLAKLPAGDGNDLFVAKRSQLQALRLA